jgi:hypothetical protein
MRRIQETARTGLATLDSGARDFSGAFSWDFVASGLKFYVR